MKKMMSIILIITMSILIVSGCGDKNAQQENNSTEQNNKEESKKEDKIQVDVIVPSGTPTMSLLKMMKEKPEIGNDVVVNYESISSTDALRSKIINEEAQIAIVPTNLAAILYNKGLKYTVAGTSVWGNLYLISDKEVNSFDELKGKEITLIGRGLTPDILFRYIMKANGIDPDKDLKLNYLKGATELAPYYINGESSYSLMPEPMLTMVKSKKENTNILIDFQEQFKEILKSENSYPQASIFVSQEFIENHKDILNSFLEEYKKNIDWINENPDKAGEYAEELDLGLKKPIVSKSLPGSNIKFVNVEDAKDNINKYLQILMDFSPQTVGGKLPDEGFYLQ